MPLRHSVEGNVRDGRQFHGHRSLRACGVVQYDRTAAAISSVVHSSAADVARAGVSASTLCVLAVKTSLARRRPIMPISGVHRPGAGVALDRLCFPEAAATAGGLPGGADIAGVSTATGFRGS